jgi:arsenite methyltransferase
MSHGTFLITAVRPSLAKGCLIAAASSGRQLIRWAPGGRVSLFEPVNRLMRDQPGWFCGYDMRRVASLAERVDAVYDWIQPPDSDPMMDFDERDLVRHAENAGFPEVGLELRLRLKASKKPCPWETFLRTSGNPLILPLGEVLHETLSTEESAVFTAVLKPLVEAGHGQDRLVVAHLTAVKG